MPGNEPYLEHLKRLQDYLHDELHRMESAWFLPLPAGETRDRVEMPRIYQSRRPRFRDDPPAEPPREFTYLRDAFSAYNSRMLLLGEPGAGKTSSLLLFAVECIAARLMNPDKPLPIYAPIYTWDGQSNIIEWLGREVPYLSVEAIREEVGRGRALLLLDGLDELPASLPDRESPNASSRDLRAEFMRALGQINATPTLITCRVKDYDDIVRGADGQKLALEGAVTLHRLTDEFIARYLEDQPELWAVIQPDPDLLDMVRTPLLLTLLSVSASKEDAAALRAIKDRGELRDAIIGRYVRYRYEFEQARSVEPLPFTLEEVYEGLGMALLRMLNSYVRRDKTGLVRRDIGLRYYALPAFAQTLHLLLAVEQWQPWIASVEEDDFYRFPHLMIRDHIALQYCLMKLNDSRLEVRREAAEALGKIGNEAAVSSLLKTIRDDVPVRFWAVEALTEMGKLALPRLIEASADQDEAVSDAARGVLRRLGLDPDNLPTA